MKASGRSKETGVSSTKDFILNIIYLPHSCYNIMEEEANFLRQPLPKPCAPFPLHRGWLCTIKTACLPSSAALLSGVLPGSAANGYFLQTLRCHPLHLVLQKGFPTPHPSAAVLNPSAPLWCCYTAQDLSPLSSPSMPGTCQRAKKGSSCCQTRRWTKTPPELWKVMAKVAHTEPQRGNSCVVGSLDFVHLSLWDYPMAHIHNLALPSSPFSSFL